MQLKNFLPIIIVNAVAVASFSIYFLSQRNYEFIIYIFVILFFAGVIVTTLKRVQYTQGILWGLTLWSILHMAGGGIIINGQRLYALMFYTFSESYGILRYDQVIHIYGFYVTTLVMYHILRPHLAGTDKRVALSIVVVMAGLGAGALNEIVEFAATVVLPDTGVGGYVNTSLDLVADLLGALGAMFWIWRRENKSRILSNS